MRLFCRRLVIGGGADDFVIDNKPANAIYIRSVEFKNIKKFEAVNIFNGLGCSFAFLRVGKILSFAIKMPSRSHF